MVEEQTEATRRAHRALDAANFFLADVRDGLGPYLAIYLLSEQRKDRCRAATTLAGLMVVHAGYSAAFLVLGAVAAMGFILYLFAMPETRDHTSAHDEAANANAAVPVPLKIAAE